MHKAYTAAQDRGGKAHQITDDTAAKGNHDIVAFDLLIHQPIDRAGQLCPAFCGLARRQCQRLDADVSGVQSGAQTVQMVRRNRFIADHNNTFAAQQRGNQRACLRQQIGADHHIIGAALKTDMNRFSHYSTSSTSGRSASASTTRCAIASIDSAGVLATVISASR